MLLDSHNCRTSVALWSVDQIPTAHAPVRAPGGQSIYTKIPIILWTSSINEVWVRRGVMSVGGQVSMACGKVFPGPTGFWPNALGGRNNCLQQSGCGSKLPSRKSWFNYLEELNAGREADSHWVICDLFPEGKTYQLDLVNLWYKGSWGRCRICTCVPWRAESVLCASEWVVIAWRKVSFA